MISRDDVKKLADLARIEVSGAELESLAGDMEAILDYVGQVSSFASHSESDSIADDMNVNVLREDDNPNPSGAYSKELIAEFPDKEGDYLKVKKILNGHPKSDNQRSSRAFRQERDFGQRAGRKLSQKYQR
jgi:aspartyl-tRNA(Asn)/glutamyl-tRNA(Gln) amidotransferase subunit C